MKRPAVNDIDLCCGKRLAPVAADSSESQDLELYYGSETEESAVKSGSAQSRIFTVKSLSTPTSIDHESAGSLSADERLLSHEESDPCEDVTAVTSTNSVGTPESDRLCYGMVRIAMRLQESTDDVLDHEHQLPVA